MSEMVRATETFACEHGLIHWQSEWPADAVAVKAFPQFFEPVEAEAPAPKKVGRPRKATNG